MIRINETFTAKREKYQWILTEQVIGKDKDGNPKPKNVDCYFSKASQMFSHILNERIDVEGEQTLQALMLRMNQIAEQLGNSLEGYNND